MVHIRRRAVASLAATGLVLGGAATAAATTARAASAAPVLDTRITVPRWASRVVSPQPGIVQVVGLDRGLLSIYSPNAQTNREISVQHSVPNAATVDAAAVQGITYVLVSSAPTGAFDATPAPTGALYRIDAAGTVTQMDLPQMSAPGFYVPLRLSAEGGRVALTGIHKTAVNSYLGLEVTSVLDAGTWTTYRGLPEDERVAVGDQPAILVDGHPLDVVSAYGQHAFSTLRDLSREPATIVGPVYDLRGSSDWRFGLAVTASSPTTATVWGYRTINGTTGGLCRRLSAGTATDCPAPALKVSAAALLASGDQVLAGGGLTAADGAPSTITVAHPDGTFTDAGAPASGRVSQLTTDPAAGEVWALGSVETGLKFVQRVSLGTSPTPTPTGTPTAPTTQPTPTGGPTTTPTAGPTTTSPLPTPTRTHLPKPKKPKRPHPPTPRRSGTVG